MKKWKNEKLVHKFSSIMYTNIYTWMWIISKEKFWILLLNNISMSIPWKKLQTHDLWLVQE